MESTASTPAALGIGIYSVPEAERLTGISGDKIRRWLWGTASGDARPLWDPQHPVLDGSKALGFRDLIEIRFVDAFREAGVSLHQIRGALDSVRRLIETEYPLSTLHFKTDGKKIYADIEGHNHLLLEIPSQQHVFRFPQILDRLRDGLEYREGDLVRWRPKNNRVLLDPRRGFGHPIVDEGVPTDVLASAYATEGSLAAVAKWYDVDEDSVRDAIEFEAAIAA